MRAQAGTTGIYTAGTVVIMFKKLLGTVKQCVEPVRVMFTNTSRLPIMYSMIVE